VSRIFDNDSSNSIGTETPVLTAAPITVSAWFKTNRLTGSDQEIFLIGRQDDPDKDDGWRLVLDVSSADIRWKARQGPGGGQAISGGTVSTDTWHHAAAVETTSLSRIAYLDGVGGVINTTSSVPANLTRTIIGKHAPGVSNEFDGEIGHVAVWDIALTTGEIESLASGISPLRIRRENLVSYWPINGQTPEKDIVGDLQLDILGGIVQGEEPPIQQAMKAGG